METTDDNGLQAEELAMELGRMVRRLQKAGRYDLMLRAITVPVLEQLRIEAARSKLSRLVITRDFRFILSDYNKEVTLTPVHKALYMLFLNHEEGIEFKDLADHRDELRRIYRHVRGYGYRILDGRRRGDCPDDTGRRVLLRRSVGTGV